MRSIIEFGRKVRGGRRLDGHRISCNGGRTRCVVSSRGIRNPGSPGVFEGGNCRHQGRIAWWKRDARPDTPPYDTLYHLNCQWTMDFENQYATPYATMMLYKLLKFVDALYHFHLWIDRGGAMLGYEDLYPVFR